MAESASSSADHDKSDSMDRTNSVNVRDAVKNLDINKDETISVHTADGLEKADINKDAVESTKEGTSSPESVKMTIGDESAESELSDFDEEVAKEAELDITEDERIQRKELANQIKENGNQYFKEAEFTKARNEYTTALKTCPISFTNERSILFANRAACLMKMEKNSEAVLDCNRALDLNPNYLKALLRRAQLYKSLDKLDEALADYQHALELDPNILEARQAVMTLPEEIKDRNEKLKTEMMGKLKELGNMVLRPFGLSTENFNLVQDPNSGGYSVNFQQNQTK